MLNDENFVPMLRGEVQRWSTKRIARYVGIYAVLYTLAIGGALLYSMPLLIMVSTSLKSQDTLYERPFRWIPSELHFENFVHAWTAFPFSLYLRNTVFITTLVVIGAVISTSLAGYALARIRFPARKLFFALLIASMLLPGDVTFIPEFIIWWKLGFVNTYVPLIAPAWMALGASKIFLLRQFFRTIPMELEDAGKIDGANPLQRYWSILLPLSKPALGVVMIFEFIGSWNSFVTPLIYLKNQDLYTLNIGLNMFKDAYNEEFSQMANMHWFMAIATLIVIPILLVFIFLQKYFVEGIQLTGLKG